MKTTEIFVEQVLIGLLVLATGFLPYIDTNKIKELKEYNSIVEGALIIATAYLLGIVFDRFADTLLSRLEQYHRLGFTLDLIKKGKQYSSDDPYPEDRLKIKILKGGKEPNEYEHYLRIRIRLSRALAVFTPALTISALLLLLQSKYDEFILSITGLTYLICFAVMLYFPKLPSTDEIDIEKAKTFKIPRFIKPTKLPVPSEIGKNNKKKKTDKFLGLCEPTIIAAFILLCVAVYVAVSYSYKWYPWVIIPTGAAISAISFLSWYRISETFMKFLMAYDRENNNSENDNAPREKHVNQDTKDIKNGKSN